MARFGNTNVASDRGAFVGREHELSAIDLAFGSGVPLLSVVGAPGTGKTRLALRYAASQRETLCDLGGVWFCDLSEARSAEALSSAVAARLGVPLLHAASDAATRVGYALARRGAMLVVLDNFEQLPEEAAAVVERWVRSAPQAMFLVTSQRRLGIADEQVLELAPLEAPAEGDVAVERVLAAPAAALFVARARALSADYQLTEETAPLVSAIVRRLEGIPLGIELCAARVGVLGERQLLERLERQLDVLVAGRAATARHSTLRTAIDWSWKLLGPWQQAALAQCSVFRGGFSLEAVEHVVDVAALPNAPSGPLWADQVVRSLTGASLIRAHASDEPGSERRYSLLESVRHFAAEQLEQSGEAARTTARHAAHFVSVARGWAEGVDGHGGVELRRRLAVEQGNVLAAYEHELGAGRPSQALAALLTLEPVFATRGPFGQYTALLDATLAHSASSELDPVVFSRARASRGLLAILQGRLDDAVGDFTTALDAAERARDADGAVFAVVKIGLCHGLAGRGGDAEHWFERARTSLDRTSGIRVQRTYFNDLGLVRTQQGRVDEALGCLERALELHQRTGNRRDEGVTLGNIGGRLYERGQLNEAVAFYERAIEVLREVDDRRSAGVMLAHIGQVAQELGRFDEARAKLCEALAVLREVGDWAWEGIVLGMLGNVDLECGRYEDAVEHFRQSVITLTGSSYRRNAGLSLASLASAEALCGRPDAARRAIDRAREVLFEVGSPSDRQACELFELACELAAHDPGETLRQRASARVAELSTGQALSDEVRLPLRLLRTMLEQAPVRLPASRPEPALTIGPRAAWFVSLGGERVDLSRRGPLRRMLLALVEQRVASPGAGLGVGQLAQLAWPEANEGARGLSARVYVGIGTLRRLGLGQTLLRGDDGYLLDPAVELTF